MASAVEMAAEVVEAVGEETLETAETIRRFTGENVSFFTGGAIIGVAAGVGVAYFVLGKRLEAKYERIANEEIAEMKDHYDRKLIALDNKEEKKTLEAVVQEQKYAVDENEGDGRVPYHRVGDKTTVDEPVVGSEGEDEAVVQSIFDETQPVVETPGWDYNTEVASRTSDKPFVIHRDEYMENRWDYGTSSLTYFEGDDVLSDERDRVVEDQDVIGLENLGKFGHGSNDPKIVYVCNPVLELLVEVTHSSGNYAQEVHGFTDDEIKHSAVRRPSRRSRYDDSD